MPFAHRTQLPRPLEPCWNQGCAQILGNVVQTTSRIRKFIQYCFSFSQDYLMVSKNATRGLGEGGGVDRRRPNIQGTAEKAVLFWGRGGEGSTTTVTNSYAPLLRSMLTPQLHPGSHLRQPCASALQPPSGICFGVSVLAFQGASVPGASTPHFLSAGHSRPLCLLSLSVCSPAPRPLWAGRLISGINRFKENTGPSKRKLTSKNTGPSKMSAGVNRRKLTGKKKSKAP